MSIEKDIREIQKIMEDDYEGNPEAKTSTMFKPATPEEVKTRKSQLVQVEYKELIQKIKDSSTTRPDGSLIVNMNIDLSYKNIESMTYIGLNIHTVNGDFRFNHCGLMNLAGCPKIINGRFDISDNSLVDLRGGPIRVSGDYDCERNNLTSLNGIAKYIGGRLDLTKNYNLHDFSDLENIEVRAVVRTKKGSLNLKDFDYMKLKLRRGINYESVNESFKSEAIRFLSTAMHGSRMHYHAKLKFDQITDADVEILNDPVKAAKDFKRGLYKDDVLFFVLIELTGEKQDKLYAAYSGKTIHVPHLLFVLGIYEEYEASSSSDYFKGPTYVSKAALADIVIRIPKSKFSSEDVRSKRREAYSGVLTDADVRAENHKRYGEILAARRSNVQFADIAKELLDTATNLRFDVKMGNKSLSDYKVLYKYYDSDKPNYRYFNQLLEQIWDNIDKGSRYVNDAKDGDEYYTKQSNLLTSKFVSVLKALKDKVINLDILH